MIPVFCRVKHDPENGTYGDCIRACVASIMELDAEAVPHFYDDGCPMEIGDQRMRVWLTPQGFVPFMCAYDGQAPLADFLAEFGAANPALHYILFGRTTNGGHVVVCHGANIVHDPSWVKSPLIGPDEGTGNWVVMVIAKS